MWVSEGTIKYLHPFFIMPRRKNHQMTPPSHVERKTVSDFYWLKTPHASWVAPGARCSYLVWTVPTALAELSTPLPNPSGITSEMLNIPAYLQPIFIYIATNGTKLNASAHLPTTNLCPYRNAARTCLKEETRNDRFTTIRHLAQFNLFITAPPAFLRPFWTNIRLCFKPVPLFIVFSFRINENFTSIILKGSLSTE